MLSLIDSLEIRNLVHFFGTQKKDSHKFSLQLPDFKVVPPGIVTYLQVAVYHYFSESH